MARVAFLGLGQMGAPMARRLIDAGHELIVWNRTKDKAEPFRGRAEVAATPAEAAGAASTVITMLASPKAVEDVLFGPEGAAVCLGGSTLVEMSTVGPDFVSELARRLPDTTVVDAPVLGSVPQAEQGSLKIYVGAGPGVFERVRPLLEALGSPVRFGDPGSGAAMKLVANSTLGSLMCIAGEALALADALGLDQELVLSALLESPIGPAIARKLDNVRSDRYPPNFKLHLALKDKRLVLDAARRRRLELRVVDAARAWIERGVADGLGDLDYSAVIAAIRGRSASA